MRLFKWFRNKTYPPALIADNAIKQYQKAKFNNLGDTPKEIAEIMWSWRYINATLNAKSQQHLLQYLDAGFPIDTVMDFCLSSFDIEFYYGPHDLETYDYAAKSIGQELSQNGVPSTAKDIDFFVDKWDRYIQPLR